MAIKALDSSVEVKYELDRDPDKGKAGATKFNLGAVPARIMAHFRDKAQTFHSGGDGENFDVEMNANSLKINLVKVGLKGWENFVDSNGNDVKFETQKKNVAGAEVTMVKDKCIDYLSMDDIDELAEQINEINNVEEDTAKKSGK